MKKIILAFTIIFSLTAQSQIDSTQLKASLTLQVKDWLYVSDGIKHNTQFERLYDSIKLRIYAVTNPNSTVSGKIDSISVGNLLAISRALRARPFGTSFFVFDRINVAIRSISNPYLQSQLDIMDQQYTDAYNAVLQDELNRLKQARQ